VKVQTAPTFSRIRFKALNLPISVLSSDRNQSKDAPDYLRRLATALAYNAIMKIEAGNTPKYQDRSQSGAAGKRAMAVKSVLAAPFAASYLLQSKQKKTDNLSASKPAVSFIAHT